MMRPDDSRRSHEAIRAAAYALRDCVRAGPPLTDLGRLRMNLANTVREHLPTQQGWNKEARGYFADQMPTYERIMEEDRELRLRYSDHIRRWSSNAIASNVPAYAADVATLVERLDRYLRSLKHELYKPMHQAGIEA